MGRLIGTEVIKRFLLSFGLVGFLLPLSLYAQKTLYMVKGATISLPVSEMVDEVAIDNPSIADVEVVDDELLISGKKAGKTKLTVSGDTGVVKYDIVVWEQDINLVASKLQVIISNLGLDDKVVVKKDEDNGLVYLVGEVFTDKEMQDVEQAVSACGDMVVVNLVRKADIEDSVRLSLNIMEVSRSALENLGIQWPQEIRFFSSEVADPSENGATFSDTLRFNIWDRAAISLVVSALESKGKARILATPNVLAANGESAKIVVGGELPIIQRKDDDIYVEYKPYGVVLEMVPKILRDGLRLEVNCEISDIDEDNKVTVNFSGTDQSTIYSVPAFLTRRANTVVTMKDGDTLIMGGLIKNDSSKTVSALPGFSKLPILGELFKSKEFNSGKTELVITVTPKIVRLGEKEDKSLKQISSLWEKRQKSNASSMKLDSLQDYLNLLQRRLRKAVDKYGYLKRTGKVIVSIHINEQGKILGIKITKSSGDKVLDRAALMCIRDIQPFPPLPEEIEMNDLWIDVPVYFVGRAAE